MLSPLVTNFVDAALAQLRRLDLMRRPGKLPDEMRDSSIAPCDDWVGWRAIPSTVTDADLDALERETGLTYPPLYRDFLQYLHFVDLTERGLRFEPHRCHDWRETLRAAYFRSWLRERILDVGLLPFGSEAMMDAGPACFDTRRRMADGDCAVVFWDHEWVGTDKEVQPMFSSSRKMFECLALIASVDFDFFYDVGDEDSSLLPQKRELLAKFLSLDQDGAGGPARAYWTSWGVATSPE
jgi:SMI1/KNR4 family protein SUKH-1